MITMKVYIYTLGKDTNLFTKLAWVQAQSSLLQHSSVFADGADVKIHKNGQSSEGCDSQPGQHKYVCQHDELQNVEITLLNQQETNIYRNLLT